MTNIPTATLQQLQEFCRTVKENELKAGEVQERMKALDPRTEEYWRLFEEAKQYWQKAEDAHQEFKNAGGNYTDAL